MLEKLLWNRGKSALYIYIASSHTDWVDYQNMLLNKNIICISFHKEAVCAVVMMRLGPGHVFVICSGFL